MVRVCFGGGLGLWLGRLMRVWWRSWWVMGMMLCILNVIMGGGCLADMKGGGVIPTLLGQGNQEEEESFFRV